MTDRVGKFNTRMADKQTISAIVTGGIQLQLIPPPKRTCSVSAIEPKGVVYTKKWVVELLLDLSGYCSDKNLVDILAIEPAAGDGAFLGPMIERLVESCGNFGRSLSECEHSLIAYELDETSAARARAVAQTILTNHGAKHTLAKQLAEAWVVNRDYLLAPNSTQADFIIGNPPYIRLEEIPEETATVYRNAYPTMRGRADLYVAFFEAALRQLKHDGVCAFICADRWMRNQYGTELRRLISSAYSVEMLLSMHHANAFDEEVDAYPAITIIRHNKQQSTIVARADQDAENIQPKLLATMLQTNNRDILPQGIHRAVVNTWFKGAAPWPCHSPEQLALLRQLEDQFPPLELNARVGIGVATGSDRVFLTTDAELVESSRLLKLALAKDLSDGTVRWSGHYLVNPWNHDGLVDLKTYPKLQAYYEQHAATLKKRHTAEKSINKWYKTIDRVNHTLTGTHKLYIPDIKNTLEPVLDRGETYPHHNLYFIHSDKWDLEVLGGLLMSKVGQFFIESYGIRMRGGYLRFQAQYLRRIRVPLPATLSARQSDELRDAFRRRDKPCATQVTLDVYGIDLPTLEAALEH